jgi:hypothetical protein
MGQHSRSHSPHTHASSFFMLCEGGGVRSAAVCGTVLLLSSSHAKRACALPTATDALFDPRVRPIAAPR